jgi:hypothetical protein
MVFEIWILLNSVLSLSFLKGDTLAFNESKGFIMYYYYYFFLNTAG